MEYCGILWILGNLLENGKINIYILYLIRLKLKVYFNLVNGGYYLLNDSVYMFIYY